MNASFLYVFLNTDSFSRKKFNTHIRGVIQPFWFLYWHILAHMWIWYLDFLDPYGSKDFILFGAILFSICTRLEIKIFIHSFFYHFGYSWQIVKFIWKRNDMERKMTSMMMLEPVSLSHSLDLGLNLCWKTWGMIIGQRSGKGMTAALGHTFPWRWRKSKYLVFDYECIMDGEHQPNCCVVYEASKAKETPNPVT